MPDLHQQHPTNKAACEAPREGSQPSHDLASLQVQEQWFGKTRSCEKIQTPQKNCLLGVVVLMLSLSLFGGAEVDDVRSGSVGVKGRAACSQISRERPQQRLKSGHEHKASKLLHRCGGQVEEEEEEPAGFADYMARFGMLMSPSTKVFHRALSSARASQVRGPGGWPRGARVRGRMPACLRVAT